MQHSSLNNSIDGTTALTIVTLPSVEDVLAGQIAASTSAMYRRDIKAYITFARSTNLDPMNPITLASWRDSMVLDSTKSPNTINRMLSAVRSLFREASRPGREIVDEGLAARFEKVQGVKKKALKHRLKQHSRTRISPEDMRRLCESPDTSTLVGIRDRAMLATLASSGVRASELASLTVDQIIKKGSGYQLSVCGKTDSDYRDAALSQEAYSLIVRWLERRSIVSTYVFTAFAGKGDRLLDAPISESGLWKCVVKYSRKCGLQFISPHDFRRFVGTRLTANGDIRKAQKALGHADIAITAKHYVLDELEVGITDHLY